MARAKTPRKPERGNFETLASGAIRVRVYAGIDPLTGRAHYLKETVPAGPDVAKEAEKTRTRLLNQVDEGRNPRTKATVDQLMDRYLELLDVDVNTRRSYEGYIRNHIRPLLGKLPVGRLNGETFDSFYAILRTCRAHCGGRKYIEHRKSGPHECSDKCHPHKCSPLSQSSIRQVHWCLSGALKRQFVGTGLPLTRLIRRKHRMRSRPTHIRRRRNKRQPSSTKRSRISSGECSCGSQ
jgi:hypothetical protein